MVAASREVLIHRIVNDLIDQMIESLPRSTAYIHSGSHSYSLKAFKDLDTFLIISLGFRHEKTSYIKSRSRDLARDPGQPHPHGAAGTPQRS